MGSFQSHVWLALGGVRVGLAGAESPVAEAALGVLVGLGRATSGAAVAPPSSIDWEGSSSEASMMATERWLAARLRERACRDRERARDSVASGSLTHLMARSTITSKSGSCGIAA